MSLKQHFFKLQLLLDELHSDLLDLKTLHLIVLDLSHVQQLTKSKNLLIFIQNILIDNIDSPEFPHNYATFKKLLSFYDSILNSLSNESFPNGLSVSNFKFQETELNSQISLRESLSEKKHQVKKSKSVRFKDNLVDYSPSLKTSLGSQSAFGPYKDFPEISSKDNLFQLSIENNESNIELENTKADVNSLPNRQIFINNQQEIVNQDSMINILSESVRSQRSMALNINEEISDQMVLLDDLENGVVNSNSRLVRTNSKLTRFREQVRKNGDWYTIFILICILLLLLVVLK